MAHAIREPLDVDAIIDRREKVRAMRVKRHLVVAAVAAVGLAVIWIVPVLFAISLDSLARAGNAHFGYLWGMPHNEPMSSTLLDRVVGRTLQHIKTRSAVQEPPEQKIRLLDP